MAVWANNAVVRPFHAAMAVGRNWTVLGSFPVTTVVVQPYTLITSPSIGLTGAVNLSPQSTSTVFGWR